MTPELEAALLEAAAAAAADRLPVGPDAAGGSTVEARDGSRARPTSEPPSAWLSRSMRRSRGPSAAGGRVNG